jgi:hypothetical protein
MQVMPTRREYWKELPERMNFDPMEGVILREAVPAEFPA